MCFGKCVSDFKMLRGEHDALVASAYTSLAELYLRTNNPKEAKVHYHHCYENFVGLLWEFEMGVRFLACDAIGVCEVLMEVVGMGKRMLTFPGFVCDRNTVSVIRCSMSDGVFLNRCP